MDNSRRPVVVVLHGTDRPPRMSDVEQRATVRYSTGPLLTGALPGADVLFVWDSRAAGLAEALPSADALRWAHAAGATARHLPLPRLHEAGVAVSSARGVFDEPMAEYVLSLVLAFAKDLPATMRLQQRRVWHHRETERLAGSHALVIGVGPIGRAIGRKLRAVGVSVSAVGRSARRHDPDLGDISPMSDLRVALSRADYVILATPLTAQTQGMIDEHALRAMRPTARLVNISRGGLIVLPDLVNALDAGALAGAALNVFADEPLPAASPLWDLPDVVVSPHMAGDIKGWRDELVRLFADNLDRYIAGVPLVNLVPPGSTA
ncbi:D-2-hydroxyacid dehydrogenase [Actinokineospora guangxiensis]|uniref:D-2-hydroxyacid dehydrogenase n=1 Tax=Actinokineospora guangxiensis TaxID=1490288 RepID=A0ABW0EV99_9PSEU